MDFLTHKNGVSLLRIILYYTRLTQFINLLIPTLQREVHNKFAPMHHCKFTVNYSVDMMPIIFLGKNGNKMYDVGRLCSSIETFYGLIYKLI